MPATFTPLINEIFYVKAFMFMVRYSLSSKAGYFGGLRNNDINKCTRTIAINQDCPRQIMTYVHSVIENGNARPSPLLSSLQLSERDRKWKNNTIILFYYFYHRYSRFLSSLVWFYLILIEPIFTNTIVILYMRKTSEREVKYITHIHRAEKVEKVKCETM